MSEPQQALACPLLFKKTEQLGEHELEFAIQSDIFSEPGGSHEAFHFLLQALGNKDTPNYIKETIETVFGSETLKERIQRDWNLYYGYDHAKLHQQQMDRYASYDLASQCIEECHFCFRGLLAYKMVEPSFFCHTGHSFFWLAARSEKVSRAQEELVEHVLLLLSPEDLLKPFSVRDPGEDRYSIFQASTWYQTRFIICLKRLGSLLNAGLASLGPEEIRKICLYVNPEIADLLFDSGLDLGKPHLDDTAPGWFGVVAREDPVPMFNWFRGRGYEQPEGFLKYAASHNLTEAASWIMDHDQSRQDWRDAALIAAESTDDRSAGTLKVILSGLAENLEIGKTLAEDTVIKIVTGVCEEAKKLQRESLLEIENVAINKIRTLRGFIREVDVMGVTIMTGNAGMSRLAIVLEDMNQHV
ncbi:hypothetical protein PENSTE_c023G08388 [Penicillium steckii]|uniref:Uncharacterized protein n=1 Tax=Penicillium steckii TaxID=303698 RepID=A0A1V6SST8_9EURO|nr:hypothetical protein PENSTE_c023G08388 [Penicillium steckii]